MTKNVHPATLFNQMMHLASQVNKLTADHPPAPHVPAYQPWAWETTRPAPPAAPLGNKP